MTELWFDTRDGKLLAGEDAVEPRLMGAGPGDVIPLQELLEADDFPFDKESYSKDTETLWDRDKLTDFGHWVINVINNGNIQEETKTIRQQHIMRLYTLRLGPSRELLNRTFGTLWEYRQEIDAPPDRSAHKYDDWSLQDFVAYAATIAESLGKKPTREDYRQAYLDGKGPGVGLLFMRTGGLRLLNEHLGYPNIHDWDEDDYIAWGVRVMDANDGLPLTQRIIDHLSKQKLGPSASIVKKYFGRSIIKFQAFVENERAMQHAHKQEMQQMKLLEYDRLVSTGVFPKSFNGQSDDQKAVLVSKYAIAKRCVNDQPPSVYFRLATSSSSHFITAIKRYSPNFTAGEVEQIAVSLEAMDEIWPATILQQRLKIPNRVLRRLRNEQNIYARKRRAA